MHWSTGTDASYARLSVRSSGVTAHSILLPTVFTRISTAWAARSTMESLVSERESGDVDSKRRTRQEECDVVVR